MFLAACPGSVLINGCRPRVLSCRRHRLYREQGFSTGRRYTVNEPLPAAGTAEVWIFEVQYRLNNAPFGQISQPLELTVRG